jgi:hypothetical protein
VDTGRDNKLLITTVTADTVLDGIGVIAKATHIGTVADYTLITDGRHITNGITNYHARSPRHRVEKSSQIFARGRSECGGDNNNKKLNIVGGGVRAGQEIISR